MTADTYGATQEFTITLLRKNPKTSDPIAKGELLPQGQQSKKEPLPLGGPGYYFEIVCSECSWELAFEPR
jgi:hypothetical protein